MGLGPDLFRLSSPHRSRGDETGRRTGLIIPGLPTSRAGSIPAPGKQPAMGAVRSFGLGWTRSQDERVEIALVTSRCGKRRVVPKGSLDDGEDAVDAANRETEEEAGLIGEFVEPAIGRYCYTEQNDRYHVDVYLMRVTGVVDSWTEAGFRHRRFMPVEDALTLLHPVLQGFVHEAARLIRAHCSRPPVSASVARV